MMAQRAVRDFFRLPMFDQLNLADARRRTQVIHNRIRLVESLRREDMLVSDAFVFISRRRAVAMKPDVMFSRNFAKSLIVRHFDSPLQISSCFLFSLQCFKQRFEVTFAEALCALALDNFEKERRPVFHRLSEYLEQIPFVVAINQNAKPL